MILGILKSVIFYFFLLVNFIQPSKTDEYKEINKNEKNKSTKLSWLKVPSNRSSSNSSKILLIFLIKNLLIKKF